MVNEVNASRCDDQENQRLIDHKQENQRLTDSWRQENQRLTDPWRQENQGLTDSWRQENQRLNTEPNELSYCRRLYNYALPVLCVWVCLVTFVAFPVIVGNLNSSGAGAGAGAGAGMFQNNDTLVLLARVESLQDELVSIRHEHTGFAEVLRKLNQSHDTERKMDMKVQEQVAEFENAVNKKYQSLIQADAEIGKKLTILDQLINNTRGLIQDGDSSKTNRNSAYNDFPDMMVILVCFAMIV